MKSAYLHRRRAETGKATSSEVVAHIIMIILTGLLVQIGRKSRRIWRLHVVHGLFMIQKRLNLWVKMTVLLPLKSASVQALQVLFVFLLKKALPPAAGHRISFRRRRLQLTTCNRFWLSSIFTHVLIKINFLRVVITLV